MSPDNDKAGYLLTLLGMPSALPNATAYVKTSTQRMILSLLMQLPWERRNMAKAIQSVTFLICQSFTTCHTSTTQSLLGYKQIHSRNLQ